LAVVVVGLLILAYAAFAHAWAESWAGFSVF
jgi:hypothetical protein